MRGKRLIMKKKVFVLLLILAVILSSTGFSYNGYKDVSTTIAASKKTQSYYIRKGKVYNRKNKLVKNKLVTINKKKYYAQKKGTLAKTKFFNYKGKKYYAGKSGVISKNKLITVKKKQYYCQKDYSIATSKTVTVKDKTYNANKNGVLKEVDPEAVPSDKPTAEPSVSPTATANPAAETDTKEETVMPTTPPAKTQENTISTTPVSNPTPSLASEVETDESPLESVIEKEDAKEYLTPQDFDAQGDGVTDDTQAFRKLFKAAYNKGFPTNAKPNENPGWQHAKPIYIPSGTYVISGAVIDETMGIHYCMYEISGAGKDSTKIKLTGSVLFNNQSEKEVPNDNRPIFGFSTFRDIAFEGNNKNTFMNLRDCLRYKDPDNPDSKESEVSNHDGPQRLQYFNCSFSKFKTIYNCISSYMMLSEMTFSYCDFTDCGEAGKECKLFIANDSQAVNWRFINSDITNFYGDAFYFEKGTGIIIIGGSITPKAGTVFNFAISGKNLRYCGASNSPQINSIGTRYKINSNSTLAKSTLEGRGNAKLSFNSCYMGTDKNVSDSFIDVRGTIVVLFEDCYECDDIRIDGDIPTITNPDPGGRFIMPSVTFRNCPSLNLSNLVEQSPIISFNNTSFSQNNVRIIVDDDYDFYMNNRHYYHTLAGLAECTQNVALSDTDTVKITNGKTVNTKPYGYVKYINIKVPNDTANAGNTVTLTLYEKAGINSDGRLVQLSTPKQIGTPTKITLGSEQVIKVEVNDFVDDLQAVFTHSLSKNPEVKMSMEIVKY